MSGRYDSSIGDKLADELDLDDLEGWRDWLRNHSSKENEVWLIISKKKSRRPGIHHEDAVEEAICFG